MAHCSLKITRIWFFGARFQALEAVNTRLREIYPESEELFDVVLVTNNHAYVGLRLINTINHHRELLTHRVSFFLIYFNILHAVNLIFCQEKTCHQTNCAF